MFALSRWPYIQTVPFSGNVETASQSLLAANGKPKTAAHCLAVASTGREIAARFDLDQAAAHTAGLLHDIAAVIKPADMLAYAMEQHWELDEAERKHPFLLHQRMSALIAREIFRVHDQTVLSAVACHTTLKPNPSDDDMALFLADKLSWDQNGAPPFYNVVSSALETSLCRASLAYIRFVLDSHMVLIPHQWLIGAKHWLETHC